MINLKEYKVYTRFDILYYSKNELYYMKLYWYVIRIFI